MTGLLVSVRDAQEACSALAGGADIIDVKEPRAGSLGAANPEVWQQVHGVLAGRAPLSVALGELLETAAVERAKTSSSAVFAKVGLAGCADVPDWRDRWSQVVACLPTTVAPVAVVYADHAEAKAPTAADVLAHAITLDCRVLLVDTHDKQHGGLFHWMSQLELRSLAREVRARSMTLVLGGSLGLDTIPDALEAEPDFIAVRGAVCSSGRAGLVEQSLVEAVAATLPCNRVESVGDA